MSATLALPILQHASPSSTQGAGHGVQDCSTCRNQHNCWATQDIDGRMLNMLVCRLQRGIDRNKTAKSILVMLRPKLRKISHWVSSRTNTPREEVLREVESRVIEQLLTTYIVGELVPPVVWLFHQKYGGIRHWAMQVVGRAARERSIYLSYDARNEEEFEDKVQGLNVVSTDGWVRSTSATPEPYDADVDVQIAHAITLIDDGRTLSTAEYRVLRFHLTNARKGEVVGGSQQWIADRMRRPRTYVTSMRAVALRKVVSLVLPSAAVPKGPGLQKFVFSRPVTESAVTLGLSERAVYKLRRALRAV